MSKLDELIKKLCPDGVEYKAIKDCCNIFDNMRKPVKKGERIVGKYPYYGANGIQDYVADYIFEGAFILVGEDGSVVTNRGTPVVTWAEGKFWVNNHAHIINAKEGVLLRYIFHALQTIEISGLIHGNIPKLTGKDFRALKIPVPPMKVQSEIARILDNFTELTARKKQYEYYRNRLLTFEHNCRKGKIIDMLARPITDGPHTTPEFTEKGIPFISAEAIWDGKIHFEKKRGYITEAFDVECCKKYKPQKNDVFMVKSGSTTGKVAYVDTNERFNVWSPLAAMRVNQENNPRFLFYLLQSEPIQKMVHAKASHGSQPNLSMRALEQFDVMIPPLDVQNRIVEVLDNFDKVCNDLHIGLPAEIEARKKQYEFYRDSLLTFLEKGESILTEQNRTELRYALIKLLQYVFGYVWLPLSTISENLDSYRKPIKQGNRIKGIYPYYGASGIVDYVKDYIFDGNFLLVSEDGANLLARVTPIAFSISGKNWVNNHAHVLKFHDLYMQKYVEFYLNFLDLQSIISGAAQPKLTKNSLDKIKIPVPDEVVLKRIVSTLERFDTLCHDISSGLPAEIEARKKQYEYYRDKLLSFKEKKG